MTSLREALVLIKESLSRGKGTFVLTKTSVPGHASFTLALGAPKAVDVGDGYIVSLGIRREQVEKLRDACDELLKEGS